MEALPFIDEHAVPTAAPRDAVWAALVRTLRRTMGGSGAFARALGCSPAVASAEFDGRVGQTLPGFRVIASEPGRGLMLEGQHRFSRYRLTFQLDGEQLLARTDAAFPGVLGRLYRTAVIGTRGHALITRRMLQQVSATARS